MGTTKKRGGLAYKRGLHRARMHSRHHRAAILTGREYYLSLDDGRNRLEGKKETVEEFLARDGKIEQVPPGGYPPREEEGDKS